MKTTVESVRRYVREALEDEDPAILLRAACVLCVSDDGRILMVSRKDDSSDFGLPGGKVDPGENEMAAAKRELEEETGLVARNVRRAYANYDGDYWVTTYTADWSGKVSTIETGVVRWGTVDDLLQGSFGWYNREMLRALGILKS